MINPFANAGTQFFICASLPATYDATGYGALTFTKIRGARSIGDIGTSYNLSAVNFVGGTPHNMRLGYNAISIDLEIITLDEPGQTLLKAAYFAETSYSYMVKGVDGSLWYFTAVCSSRGRNPGEANGVADIKTKLEVDSELLEI